MPGRPADAAGELRDLIEQRADVIDRLVRTLAQLTGAPIGLVTVVEDDAVRVVSRHGIEPAAVELAPGLFAAAMAVDDVYVVPDTHADEAAATDPLVTGPLGVRSYAAAPIVAPTGERVGNLCLLDREPRELPPEHVDALSTFARIVTDELELQRRSADLVVPDEDRPVEVRSFARLADSMTLTVWTAGPDGVVDDANAAFHAYVGVAPGEVDLPAGGWIGAIHDDDQAGVLAAWADAVERGEPYEREFRIRRHDGEYRWNVSTAFPIRDDRGVVVAWFGSAVDVHDRRVAEEALAEREQRLRAILESEPECVKVVASDGELLEMNPAGLAMIDAEHLDDVRGRPVRDLVHPDDVPTFVELHDRAARGEDGTATFRLVGLAGQVRWVESRSVPLTGADGAPSAVLSITRDVTARRRDELLRDAEARILERLVTGAPVGAVLEEIVDALDEVNDGASSIMLVEHGRLRRGAARDLPSAVLRRFDGAEVASGARCCGAAAARGERVVSSDLLTDPSWDGIGDVVVDAGFLACASTPVLDASGDVVAVIAHYLREQREPTPAELSAIDRMTRLASLAIARTRIDASLRQTTALLRVASELGHLGGWSVDVPSDGPPGSVVWSDEVAAIHERPVGYQPSVEEGISFLTPEYRQLITDAFTVCMEHGEPFDLEVEIVTATGRRRWCRTVGQAERGASGRIVRVAGAFQDITAYKESERALRESEERFRLLSRATSDVVFDWDLAADTVWYGEGLEELVGPLRSRTLSIQGIMRRIHPDDIERIRGRMAEVMAVAGDRWLDEFRVLHADGHPITVEVSGFLLRDGDGHATRLGGSLVDTTERRALEEQLAQTQRLEAVGRLTGGVAHDFNNLLTVVTGNVELLAEDLDTGSGPDPDDLRASVDMISAAARRGSELTGRLLAFARRQPLTPAVVDVARLLDGLTGLLRRTLGEDVELQVRHAADPWSAMVDAGQLESAVLNVCLNARDAMPQGGHLTIETANVELDAACVASVPDLEPGPYLAISITDDGAGMPHEVARRAFEPFFTTKPSGRGSGLGLSMVYGFATQSGGHALIESEPGHGTTVSIHLPRAATDAPTGTDTPRAAPRVRPGGNERVLLVEDDDLVRDVVAAQLRGLGYQVVEAGDGPTALALLRDAGPFALLFTDVVMPGGMNGRQLADAARRAAPGLPVLFTSGYTEDAMVHHGRLDADVALLTKPYRLDDLAGAVRRAIDDAAGSGGPDAPTTPTDVSGR